MMCLCGGCEDCLRIQANRAGMVKERQAVGDEFQESDLDLEAETVEIIEAAEKGIMLY